MKHHKSICLGALLITASLVGFSAQAKQVYQHDTLTVWDRENAAGGEGTLAGRFAFTRHESAQRHAFKEIGWMTLKPGASIGLHPHDTNEDAYIIIAGHGVFTDAHGMQTDVTAGDITIARKGEAHALKNTGDTDLIFLDIIAAQQ